MTHFETPDGLRLYFEDTGTGQPLLCLPGLTRNTRDFDFLKPHMTSCRMIAMDYRGRGQSEHASDFNSYSVPQEAQDVVALLDHLGLEKVTILGTSRGGLIAMALAAMHPDRLAGVILNDVGPVIAPGGIERIMEYVGRVPPYRTLDEAAGAMAAALGPQFRDLTAEVWHRMAAAQYEETATGLTLRYDLRLRDALLAQAEAGPPPDLWPLFDALLPLPVGVLRGANSDILSAGTLADMQARHSGLIATTVPNRGHVPLLDEPASLDLIHRILKGTK
ncbi:alpha/beta fold hydrolase [Sedimentitalea todarodis]|uniref:Alpha/beta hydrolase n=1 Tax=Sedimentitalea todarodis TaxID=1631240 RepID=A0ABU3V9T0_9RHOB|nr:alpha/beta hydrolase [Sedimentitalea todarodis]MDU9002932.1 alpha/beta hydrolase [Sedimentitalea todarodis]